MKICPWYLSLFISTFSPKNQNFVEKTVRPCSPQVNYYTSGFYGFQEIEKLKSNSKLLKNDLDALNEKLEQFLADYGVKKV